jgi:protein-tyrosine phosphatase
MLSGAWNFRDVSDLKTTEGRCVGSGFLFRSSELSGLDATGAQDLVNLGVTDVFDLRDFTEVDRNGADKVPDSVSVHVVPFDMRPDGKAPHEMTAEEYAASKQRTMNQIYRMMPALPGAMSSVDQVIKLLGNTDRRLLVHCAAGKDRTGWVVAVVLDTLGVRREDIVADYLESNGGIEQLRAHMMRVYGPLMKEGTEFEISDDLLGVRVEYLEAAYEAMEEQFGSLDNYLAACRVTEHDLERLRTRLLV